MWVYFEVREEKSDSISYIVDVFAYERCASRILGIAPYDHGKAYYEFIKNIDWQA